MRKPMFLMLAIVLLLVGGVGFYKFQQIKMAIAAGKSFSMPPEAVTTIIAKSEPWAVTIDAVGAVAPEQGVTLSADLPGVVQRVAFQSGSHVAAGAALVVLDARQERAQLAAAEAAHDLAAANATRSKSLREKDLISQAEYDAVIAQAKQSEAGAGEIRAVIERKTIRAPFSGVTGIRQVNPGQYVHSGDAIVPLQSVGSVYVNFSVPQQQVSSLKVGAPVTVMLEGSTDRHFDGRINAINPVIDEATRNVQVQATLHNATGALRPGMYVTASVNVGEHTTAVTVPTSAINYAPYGNSVFIVEMIKGPDGKEYKGVRQQFVKLGASRGDLVAVTDGIKPGQEIVTSGVFKLRTGAGVKVNNQTVPSASASPKPEDS